jgi:hypothetical protein
VVTPLALLSAKHVLPTQRYGNDLGSKRLQKGGWMMLKYAE